VPDRSKASSAAHDKAVPGHRFSWLGRVIASGQSWFAPREVVRVPTTSRPGEVGAEQVQRLAADPTPAQPKVIVVDSHFPVPPFLRASSALAPGVALLARLASNRVLDAAPRPPTGKPGRPRKHGAKLALRQPGPPDRQETARRFGQDVRISAWVSYHFLAVPNLVGLVVRVEFLRADGSPRYKRPLWLFWSGPSAIARAALVRMDLLRFTIEHFFRFLSQRLGLLAAHRGDLGPIETWVAVVVLADWQLLLARDWACSGPAPSTCSNRVPRHGSYPPITPTRSRYTPEYAFGSLPIGQCHDRVETT